MVRQQSQALFSLYFNIYFKTFEVLSVDLKRPKFTYAWVLVFYPKDSQGYQQSLLSMLVYVVGESIDIVDQ